MARQFYFSNQDNEIFDLMGRLTDFLNAPEGLGYGLNIETSELSQSLKVIDEKSSFINITGEMLFKEYADYQEFSLFVSKAITLYFHQKIDAKISNAFIECRVEGLDKSEKDYKNGYLKCPLTIKPLTLWQVKKIITIEENSEIEETDDVLPYTLPFVLGKDTMTSSLKQIEIKNEGVVSSPLILSIKGLSKNPEWYLENETTLTSGGISMIINDNQIVIIDSTEGKMQAYSGSAILDDYLYTNKKNYLYLKSGINQLFLKEVYKGEVSWIEYYYTI